MSETLGFTGGDAAHLEGVMDNHHDLIAPTDDVLRSPNSCVSLHIKIGERVEFHTIGSVLEDVRLSSSAVIDLETQVKLTSFVSSIALTTPLKRFAVAVSVIFARAIIARFMFVLFA